MMTISTLQTAIGVGLLAFWVAYVTLLGLVDMNFNMQDGLYTRSWLDGGLAAAISAWCLGFGTLLAITVGTRRPVG